MPTPPSYKVGDTQKFWVVQQRHAGTPQVTAELSYYDRACGDVGAGRRAVQSAAIWRPRQALRERRRTPPIASSSAANGPPAWITTCACTSCMHAAWAKMWPATTRRPTNISRLVNEYSNEREMFYISADSGQCQAEQRLLRRHPGARISTHDPLGQRPERGPHGSTRACLSSPAT